MQYVEILRARRVLIWYGGVLLALFALAVISIYGGNGHGQLRHDGGTDNISGLLMGCAVGAWIVTTCVAGGLNAETATLPITWTRPISRHTIAWRFVAVDVAAIVIGYAFLLALLLAFLAIFGAFGQIVLDGRELRALALGLGTTLMWYGLIVLVSSRLGAHGRVAGLSWVAFLLIGGLWSAPLPPLLHGIITALNYLNPIAYFGGSVGSSNHAHAIPFSQDVRALMAWAIAAVAITLSVRLWSTREA